MEQLSLASLAPLVLIHIRLIQVEINVVCLQNGRILVLSKTSAILALVPVFVNKYKRAIYIGMSLSASRREIAFDHGEVLPPQALMLGRVFVESGYVWLFLYAHEGLSPLFGAL